MELTKEDLMMCLGNIAYSYADGYKLKDFPMEFGTDDYYKALDTVIEDVIKRIKKRYEIE